MSGVVDGESLVRFPLGLPARFDSFKVVIHGYRIAYFGGLGSGRGLGSGGCWKR